jgi:hypothetical protein
MAIAPGARPFMSSTRTPSLASSAPAAASTSMAKPTAGLGRP